ncbi:MAG TPA: zinc-binding dehydrogenase [Clostridia bacterium]|nr:zinc-binding dehydrogenase [Clostridia bacterium]
MKHVVMTGPKQSAIREIRTVTPNDDQLLIKLKYVGVCMSEHYGWATAKAGDAFGHEPMGVIAQVGKNVKGFEVGERVSGLWGSTLPGAGGMVEYALADPKKDTVVKLPEGYRDVDFLLEPLACLMSAVSKAKVSMPGTTVCVVGSGYMGCGAISLLKVRGARVVAVDIRPESLENAKRFGADETYLVAEAKERFVKNSAFKGFDVVMEWGENNESLDLAINLTKMCGQLCVGAYHTGGKRLVDMEQLNVKAIECLSTHPREAHLNQVGARNAVDLLTSGTWKFLNVPTKVYPMGRFDQAHAELETKYGSYMKSVVDMKQEEFEPYILK